MLQLLTAVWLTVAAVLLERLSAGLERAGRRWAATQARAGAVWARALARDLVRGWRAGRMRVRTRRASLDHVTGETSAATSATTAGATDHGRHPVTAPVPHPVRGQGIATGAGVEVQSNTRSIEQVFGPPAVERLFEQDHHRAAQTTQPRIHPRH